jgi:hypothetical protein
LYAFSIRQAPPARFLQNSCKVCFRFALELVEVGNIMIAFDGTVVFVKLESKHRVCFFAFGGLSPGALYLHKGFIAVRAGSH